MRPQKFVSLEVMSDPFIVICDFIKSPWKQSHKDLGVDASLIVGLVLVRTPCVNGNLNVFALLPLSPLTLGKTLKATTFVFYTQ